MTTLSFGRSVIGLCIFVAGLKAGEQGWYVEATGRMALYTVREKKDEADCCPCWKTL